MEIRSASKMITVQRKNVYTALLVALIVGTVLNLINSYDTFLMGNFTNRNIMRIVLTYITPFCVSLYSSTRALKEKNIEAIEKK
ncbi:MAG: nitrate/nitrite transporter NrtS [Ferruginibacter sp.]